jgi:hypothetical protein
VAGFPGQVRQHGKRLQHHFRDVGRAFGHDHVVAHPERVEAQVLDRPRYSPDCIGGGELVRLWNGNAVTHRILLLLSLEPRRPG